VRGPADRPGRPDDALSRSSALGAEIAEAYAAGTDGLGELAPIVLRSIRSFPVAALAGAELTCEPGQFGARLRRVLIDRLPSTTWPQQYFDQVRRVGLIEKYHLLDGSYVAPPDAATGQPMVLELGGRVAAGDRLSSHGECFPHMITVTITNAHWANVSGLGVGVGFYT
jgi:hypothetical protein